MNRRKTLRKVWLGVYLCLNLCGIFNSSYKQSGCRFEFRAPRWHPPCVKVIRGDMSHHPNPDYKSQLEGAGMDFLEHKLNRWNLLYRLFVCTLSLIRHSLRTDATAPLRSSLTNGWNRSICHLASHLELVNLKNQNDNWTWLFIAARSSAAHQGQGRIQGHWKGRGANAH